MNKIIYFITLSILCSTPFENFKITKNQNDLGRSNGNFPDSNGIIDIESSKNSDYLWVSTGAGLGKINITSNFIMKH